MGCRVGGDGSPTAEPGAPRQAAATLTRWRREHRRKEPCGSRADGETLPDEWVVDLFLKENTRERAASSTLWVAQGHINLSWGRLTQARLAHGKAGIPPWYWATKHRRSRILLVRSWGQSSPARRWRRQRMSLATPRPCPPLHISSSSTAVSERARPIWDWPCPAFSVGWSQIPWNILRGMSLTLKDVRRSKLLDYSLVVALLFLFDKHCPIME